MTPDDWYARKHAKPKFFTASGVELAPRFSRADWDMSRISSPTALDFGKPQNSI